MDNISSIQLLMLEACLAKSKDIRENAVRRWEEEVVINDLDFSSSRLTPYFLYRNQLDGIVTKHDKRLKVIYKHWWLRTQHISHQLNEVHSALSEAGIEVIVIKGASIKMYYDREELRPMADFDLLVSQKDFHSALQIVTNLNYTANESYTYYWGKNRNLFLDFNHAMSLSHQENDTQMDLHWKIGSRCSSQFTNQLWLHLENYGLIPNAKKPQLAYELFLLIIHAVLARNKDNLTWIIDIAVINTTANHSVWIEARKLAVAEKKEHFFDYGCSILIELGLNVPNPGKVKKPYISIPTKNKEGRKQIGPFMANYFRVRNLLFSVNCLFPHSNILFKLYYITRHFRYSLILMKMRA